MADRCSQHRRRPGREAFRQGLRAFGYVEGQNMFIEYRWHAGKFENLPALASDLVKLNVDVIVAAGPQPTLAARAATAAIPIVFVSVYDPVGLGLAESLAH